MAISRRSIRGSETAKGIFKIKEKVTDLEMVGDLIDSQFIELGTVADIGCGRNKLGRSLILFSDNGPKVVKQVMGLMSNPTKPMRTTYEYPSLSNPALAFLSRTRPST
jgi:hypothetical protein